MSRRTKGEAQTEIPTEDLPRGRPGSVGIAPKPSEYVTAVAWEQRKMAYRLYHCRIPRIVLEQYLISAEEDTAEMVEAKTGRIFANEVVG